MLIASKQYDFCSKMVCNFIQGRQRHQTYFDTLEDQVAADNPVWLIDAFIDKLDLQKSGFQKRYITARAGRLTHPVYF